MNVNLVRSADENNEKTDNLKSSLAILHRQLPLVSFCPPVGMHLVKSNQVGFINVASYHSRLYLRAVFI